MNRLIMLSAGLGILFCFSSCKEKTVPEQEQIPVVALTVTEIADNCATINARLTQGNPHGGKLIRMIAQDEVTVDPENEIQFIRFIEERGESIDLPYTETLTQLKAGKKVLTAVLSYDINGRASSCAYVKWETVGMPDSWSSDNGAGSVGEIIW